MKVFNWMHRRFLHVHSGVTSRQDHDNGIERNGKSKVDVERDALLKHDGDLMVDVLNDWKEGILAIGTLAIGPLEATLTAKCELLNEQLDDHEDGDEDLYDHDEESNNYVHVLDDEDDDNNFESSPLMKMAFFSHEFQKIDDIDGANSCQETNQIAEDGSNQVAENVSEVNSDETKDCQVKRRVTLAELFLEESVKETKDSSNCTVDKDCFVTGKRCNLNTKPTSHTKNGLSKAKQLLKEELRPIKKLNQFVKRMMKKKIHPDNMVEAAAGKMQKDMRLEPSKATCMPTHQLDAADESASLLLLQDSAV